MWADSNCFTDCLCHSVCPGWHQDGSHLAREKLNAQWRQGARVPVGMTTSSAVVRFVAILVEAASNPLAKLKMWLDWCILWLSV